MNNNQLLNILLYCVIYEIINVIQLGMEMV